MESFFTLIKESASVAGLLGVVIGALISFAGTITQNLLTKRKEDLAYERSIREKVREYKREIYTTCLSELLNIKAEYYYDTVVQEELIDNDVIRISSQAAIDLVSPAKIRMQLKKIYDGLQQREGNLDVFEKEYQELSRLMNEDIGVQ